MATRVLPVARENAGDQFHLTVERGGDAVNGADERALSAADHSHAQFALP